MILHRSNKPILEEETNDHLIERIKKSIEKKQLLKEEQDKLDKINNQLREEDNKIRGGW